MNLIRISHRKIRRRGTGTLSLWRIPQISCYAHMRHTRMPIRVETRPNATPPSSSHVTSPESHVRSFFLASSRAPPMVGTTESFQLNTGSVASSPCIKNVYKPIGYQDHPHTSLSTTPTIRPLSPTLSDHLPLSKWTSTQSTLSLLTLTATARSPN